MTDIKSLTLTELQKEMEDLGENKSSKRIDCKTKRNL